MHSSIEAEPPETLRVSQSNPAVATHRVTPVFGTKLAPNRPSTTP